MARQQIDITLDDTQDLEIIVSDFGVVESTAEHQRQLIMNNKGDFKESPDSCVGVFGYLDDENFRELIRAISIEFAKDGMDVANVSVLPDGTIRSDAYYK